MKIALTKSLATLRAACILTAVAMAGHLASAQVHTELINSEGEVGSAYSYAYKDSLQPTPEDGTTYSATNLPDGLSMNSTTALISGVPTTAGLYDEIVITLTFPDQVTHEEYGAINIIAATGTPEITSAITGAGMVGEVFTYTITASNTPQSFNVVGDLPTGISFNTDTISGTPTVAGTFPVTLSGNNSSGTGEETTLTITIDPAGAVPTINSSASLAGDVDALLSYQVTATESPTSYSASGLPLGMSIDTGTGFINGTPTIEGVYDVELTATNTNGTSATFDLTVVIGDVPQISSALTISGVEDDPITDYQVSASNSPTSFTVSTESLPEGLNYSTTTKKITGTPTEVGTFNVEVYASNAIGDGTPSTIVITVEAKPDLPILRSASFNVEHQSDGSLKLYLTFDQSTEDLAAYDWLIETSANLEDWTVIEIDDASLDVTFTDNQDGSKSVSVLYPNFTPSTAEVYFRYRVATKSVE